MKSHSYRFAAPLAALFLVLVTVSIANATNLYSGRAIGVVLNGMPPGLPTMHADTGELDPSGGGLTVAMDDLFIGTDILQATAVTSIAEGVGGTTQATSALTNLRVYVGMPAELSATSVAVEANATCDAATGSVVITGLEFGGQAIRVAGTPNQIETIPGVGTLVINEQLTFARTRSITVRALHLTRVTGEHIIIGSVRAGIECIVNVEPAQWQNIKRMYRD